MYAKLVVGATDISSIKAMRDIGRLITSATPSTALLSAFSNTSSIIIDDTPAEWTYVGSVNANDQPTIAAVGSATDTTSPWGYTADTHYNLCFSAPCSSNASLLKYAALNQVWRGSATLSVNIALTGATSFTSLGVATNEGPRYFGAAIESQSETNTVSMNVSGSSVLHVVATPRHITIIDEDRGISAVWETSSTDVHTFYNKAPFVQYSHCVSSTFTREAIIVPTSTSTTRSGSPMPAAFGVNDISTGTFYGTYDPTIGSTVNQTYFFQHAASLRKNSMNVTGAPRYQISPVFLQLGALGYPTQFVTGTVPIYWTAPKIATTGDTIDVAGDSYTFFDAGSGFGVIMKTS